MLNHACPYIQYTIIIQYDSRYSLSGSKIWTLGIEPLHGPIKLQSWQILVLVAWQTADMGIIKEATSGQTVRWWKWIALLSRGCLLSLIVVYCRLNEWAIFFKVISCPRCVKIRSNHFYELILEKLSSFYVDADGLGTLLPTGII